MNVKCWKFTETSFKGHSLYLNYEVSWIHNQIKKHQQTISFIASETQGETTIYSTRSSVLSAGSTNVLVLVDVSPHLDAILFENRRLSPTIAVSAWNFVTRKPSRIALPTDVLKPTQRFSTKPLTNGPNAAYGPWTTNLFTAYFAVSFSYSPTTRTRAL